MTADNLTLREIPVYRCTKLVSGEECGALVRCRELAYADQCLAVNPGGTIVQGSCLFEKMVVNKKR